MRRIGGALAIVALLVTCWGIPHSAFAQGVITLGAAYPLTGSASLYGIGGKQALTMGMEDVNSKGGINGKKLDLIVYDTTSKPPVAATLAQRLIYEDRVPVVMGSPNSIDSLAMMEVTEKAKVPLFCSSGASPLITEKGYHWVSRLALTDKKTAILLGHKINLKPEWKRIATLYENSDYGRPPSEIVADIVKKSPGKQLVATEAFSRGDTDFHGQLEKIKYAGDADLLVVWGYYTEIALITRQMKEVGLKAQLIGNASLQFPEYVQLSGSASNGVMFMQSTSSYYNPDPRMQEFGKRFVARWNSVPSDTAIDSYDGIRVVADVIGKVGTDPEKIQNALRTLTFQGVGGEIKFDATGQAEKGAIIYKIQDGKTLFVEYMK